MAVRAAALVVALADPNRGWDGSWYASMAPRFVHYEGRAMDTGGWRPVGNGEDDEQLMLALGLQSKREITGSGSVRP